MINLVKSSFLDEKETKKKLCSFIMGAKKLSMGEQCSLFEKNFAKAIGSKHAVYVNSGSSANLIIIQSLLNTSKLSIGDNVGFSALSWSTNVMPLMQLGLNPVPVDISLSHLNIDLDHLKKVHEEKPLKALFVTNLLGFSTNMKELLSWCTREKVLLLEDNCESLGSEVDNKQLGTFGLASSFSFFVGHHLSTIEGGMVCTDDEEFAQQLTMVRAHGWARNLPSEKRKDLLSKHDVDDFYALYSFFELGYNLRPSEINGFIGNEQIKHLPFIISQREKNFNCFAQAALKNNDLFHLDVSHLSKVSNFAFPLVFKNKETMLRARKAFQENEVQVRPIVGGSLPEQPFFKKYFNCSSSPTAKLVHENGFYIPNNEELTSDEVSLLCSLIENRKL